MRASVVPHHGARRLVIRVLATHLGCEAHLLDDAQVLGAHVGLDRLDLVLVAARLEDALTLATPFPVWQVSQASTIAELVAVVESWCASADDDVADTQRSPDSGVSRRCP